MIFHIYFTTKYFQTVEMSDEAMVKFQVSLNTGVPENIITVYKFDKAELDAFLVANQSKKIEFEGGVVKVTEMQDVTSIEVIDDVSYEVITPTKVTVASLPGVAV